MKFNKIAKRFAVAALAGVLAVPSMGISAAATTGVVTNNSGIMSIDVGKTVLTDGNTYKPNTSFTFKVELGEATTYTDSANTTPLTVYKGENGGLKFVEANDAAVSTPSTTDTLEGSYTIIGGSLTVDASVFKTTGIYHYVVTEVDGGYEGIVYDTTKYDVYLFVYQNADGSYYVGNVVTSVNGVKTDLSFTNNYGDTTNPTDPDEPGKNDTTHDITVTKSVAGTMGDKTKAFDFKVSVVSKNEEIYKVEYSVDGTTTATITSVTSGAEAITLSIKNGGYIKVYGLSESDKVTIVEDSYTSDGYTTTYSDSSASSSVATGTTVSKDATQVTVTNTKDATTPTGIALTIAPYVLMVALAAVVAVVFLRKRSYEA